MTIRLAYLVTHPIQYQAPLLRRIAREPDIDLTVFFCSDLSTRTFKDPGFGTALAWDVPLLEGYKYEFLPAIGGTDHLSFWRPFNYGLGRRLREGGFDALWIHGYHRWINWVGMAWAKALGIKVLLRDEVTEISRQRGWARRAIKRVVMATINAACDGYLAIGRLNAAYYESYGVKSSDTFLVPYAVDNDRFQAQVVAAEPEREQLRAALGLQAGRPVILYASKFMSRKRAADLLEAYIRLSPDGRQEPAPYLLFIGDGEERAKVESRAAQFPWESIRFLGFKNQSELPRFYNLCDVFVLPSSAEPWGLVINEVMNAGRAVIVTDEVGCGPDLVRSGENGYVFPTGDVASLHRALAEVTSNSAIRAAMGRRSLEIIQSWGFEQDVIGVKNAVNHVLQRSGGMACTIPDSNGVKLR